jgi:hypothetical protein
MENPMQTTADLVSWLRERHELLRLIDEDLELFIKARVDPSDIEGKSVKDLYKLLKDATVAVGPAHRIAEALCKEINGPDVGECLHVGICFLKLLSHRRRPFWAPWSAFS